ncbi:MAG TPA: hypothetical protein VMV27_11005 [Candidatus Binataceae bacterium]|nr:hypothetical protein [Candidatus Binataceae bacterium]
MHRQAIRKILLRVAIGTLAAALASCATVGNSKRADAEIGCDFDAPKACASALLHPVDSDLGLTTSNPSYVTENGLATTWLQVPVRAPGGSEIDVQCQVHYWERKVIYAYAMPSGIVSGKDRQWLRRVGLCRGVPGAEPMPKLAPIS